MTKLEIFDQLTSLIYRWRREADEWCEKSRQAEIDLHKSFGLDCVSREPGLPCWTCPGTFGYFNTPREALEAGEPL